ncbi:MAG: LysR family transcriptional regulator [Acidovorax sp.]
MNIADIEYLLAVQEHRNIGRAAEALGISQPALTRAVARLEAFAGQQLFTRHPKGVLPTPAGEMLARRAQRILIEYQDAERELQQVKTGQLGLIRVGYSTSVNWEVVSAAMHRLLRERPTTRLRLSELFMQDLLDQLADGKLDMIVGPLPALMPADLVASVLYRDRLHVVADRHHPLARKKVVRLKDVAAQRWQMSGPHTLIRKLLDQRVADAKLAPLDVRVETHSGNPNQLGMLTGTQMLTVCSEWSLDVLPQFDLVPLTVADLPLDRDIGMMRRAHAYVPPIARRLEELLVAQCDPSLPAPAGAPPSPPVRILQTPLKHQRRP